MIFIQPGRITYKPRVFKPNVIFFPHNMARCQCRIHIRWWRLLGISGETMSFVENEVCGLKTCIVSYYQFEILPPYSEKVQIQTQARRNDFAQGGGKWGKITKIWGFSDPNTSFFINHVVCMPLSESLRGKCPSLLRDAQVGALPPLPPPHFYAPVRARHIAIPCTFWQVMLSVYKDEEKKPAK